MANLADFVFTKKTDKAVSEELEFGWICDSDVSTLFGNDEIVGKSTEIYSDRWLGSAGILVTNNAYLEVGDGNNKLTGISSSQYSPYFDSSYGIRIENGATVNMGAGNDQVRADAADGVALSVAGGGQLFTGLGNDKLIATSQGRASIYLENGLIDTGVGNDTVEGNSFDGGIMLLFGSSLNLGTGNDNITGKSVSYGIYLYGDSILDAGEGNDEITGVSGYQNYLGITVYDSLLTAGGGNDRITGSNTSGRLYGIAVIGSGVISAGDGDDVVDASVGGFGYGGTIDMGSGNDTVLGFGEIFIDGSIGRDEVLLPQGSYMIQADGSFVSISNSETTMTTSSVEFVGSVLSGNTLGLIPGTLLVNVDGSLSFS